MSTPLTKLQEQRSNLKYYKNHGINSCGFFIVFNFLPSKRDKNIFYSLYPYNPDGYREGNKRIFINHKTELAVIIKK